MDSPPFYQYRSSSHLDIDVERACETNHRGNKFLPFDQLPYFVHHEAVVSALREAKIKPDEDLVAFALQKARRLFLILAIMDQLPMLAQLRGHDVVNPKIDDDSLPLSMEIEDYGRPLELPFDALSETKPDARFATWGGHHRRHFKNLQRLFKVPVFDSTFRFRLDENTVLPFLKMRKEEKEMYSGNFSEVSKEKVHVAHLPLLEPRVSDTIFVLSRKQIFPLTS